LIRYYVSHSLPFVTRALVAFGLFGGDPFGLDGDPAGTGLDGVASVVTVAFLAGAFFLAGDFFFGEDFLAGRGTILIEKLGTDK
jgi:hypothetical protein